MKRQPPLDDDERAEIVDMARELGLIAEPMHFDLLPITAFQIVAGLQLAMRHPGFDGPSRETAERFVATVRACFAGSPAIQRVIDRGDDPFDDQPRRRR